MPLPLTPLRLCVGLAVIQGLAAAPAMAAEPMAPPAPLALAAAPARATTPAPAATPAPATTPAPAAELPTAELPAAPAADEPLAEFDPAQLAVPHGQLTLHQGFGLATLAAMGATATMGLLSARPGGSDWREAHLVVAGLTTGLYLTSATLALTAPPPLRRRGSERWSSVRIHQTLAWVHGLGMVGTVASGLLFAYGGSTYEPYHEAVALGTLGWMALSAGVIAFGE